VKTVINPTLLLFS